MFYFQNLDSIIKYKCFGGGLLNKVRAKWLIDTIVRMFNSILEDIDTMIKEDDKNIINIFQKHDEEVKENLKNDECLKSAFRYEMSNHEYIITYEIDETLDALGITSEEYSNSDRMKRIMKQAKINYLNEMEKFGY